MSISISHNEYGKSRVRLVKVRKDGGRHEVTDVEIGIKLEGRFEPAYAEGDNGRVLPTDTMKNTVYALAKEHPVEPIEAFGLLLGEHFLDASLEAERARITLRENVWQRLEVNGIAHSHAFSRVSAEKRMAFVEISRTEGVKVESGLEDLFVLKTTGSSFSGYPKDRFTTLKETSDRIFATLITARWSIEDGGAPDYTTTWQAARKALVETFAEQHSLSVQHTIYAMGGAIFQACPAIVEVTLALPNKHCLLVDLSPFGMKNDNEIFLPIDEPHGQIEATMRRG